MIDPPSPLAYRWGAMSTNLPKLPEVGQVVKVRDRHWAVAEVSTSALPEDILRASGGVQDTLVKLSSVEDDYARIAPERLRQITARSFDDQKKPADAASKAPTPDQAKARLEHAEKVTLSIEDCRAAALTNNLDLKVAMMDPTIAKENISREEARFESLFTLRGGWSETDSPTASDLDSSQARSKNIEPGVRIPLRTGETVEVSLPVSRTETNNSFSTLNPSYTSDLVFSLSQPLLRGAGRRANS